MSRIVCAAIRNGDLIICGVRHHDMIMNRVLIALGQQNVTHGDWEQGFVDARGNFKTREQARRTADFYSQKNRERIHPTKLFSEDLY